MNHFLLFFCVLASLVSCVNKAETGQAKNVEPDRIYYDYQVWADEDRDDATVRLQYRLDGKDGPALVLDEPSQVLFDKQPLKADSSKFTGAYYELTVPIQDFKGSHAIVFIDKNKKEHREEFNFVPFTLAEDLGEKIQKKTFAITLKDFPLTPTVVRLVITDTALNSADVNEELVVENGKIEVDAAKLDNLTKGPVTLEVYREEERPIKNGSNEGGRFSLTYGIKREFELVE